MANRASQPSVKGSSETMRMILLTCSSVGITFTWGVELTYCTPYLLSLGITKGQTSLVWIAGPLSGLVVQPIIGAISDQARWKWGRRRPVIAVGSVIAACGLLMLGFTKEIVHHFIPDEQAARVPIIALTIIGLYAADFSINAVMSCSKSLVVDTLPAQKQQAGTAWANRMSSVGHIAGYGLGAVDLVKLFGTALGDTQFKQLTTIAALGLLSTSAITCWAVTERAVASLKLDPRRPQPRFKVLHQIWSTLLHLPPRIQAICWAVFWSWIGWFPFLVYSSTWVGETYFRYDLPEEAKHSKDALGHMGRIGSMALTVYSSVIFLGAWILPLLVRGPDEENFTPRPPASIARLVERLSKLKPDLLTVWMWGHVVFAVAMALTPFASSFRFATVIVAVCGLPYTICHWAPPTFLGVEVNKLGGGGAPGAPYRRVSMGSNVELMPRVPTTAALEEQVRRKDNDNYDSPSPSSPTAVPGGSPTGELAGIYFGILNIFTTLPQFLGTFLSAMVFAVLDPGKHPELAHGHEGAGDDADAAAAAAAAAASEGPNAIAVCLFIGAFCSLGAAYATSKLRYIS
ncbi:hypothetical protein VTK73DRAFT_7605 [Phialemonium thermophilum]|uniref:Sucrose transporter n=1 Tax=Phialemonium thermophilum TaxID=223376 RepID=A0ABR3WD34_9PEZI